MRTYIVIGMMVLLTGCSSAGPFVTSISNDGRGGLTVEKCMAHFNAFLGVVNNSECSSVNISLGNPDRK